MNDTENPGSPTTTLEQPAAQTATPQQVLETPTFEASPTTATPSQENFSVTPQQTPVAEIPNASSTTQQEQKKGFFSRILGGRGGNLIPSQPSQEDPATHNAVFQTRQDKIHETNFTSNSSIPDHLPNGQTPTMTNVTPEAASNAEAPVAAPKFSQEALNSAPAESTPPVLSTEHPETSTLETTSTQVLDETPTPTSDILVQAADVAAQAEQTGGALPTDGIPAPAIENPSSPTNPDEDAPEATPTASTNSTAETAASSVLEPVEPEPTPQAV